MPNSPTNPLTEHPNSQTPQRNTTTQNKRTCDFCSKSTALLYCRADTAKLCLSCDKQVHSTNPLFKKHTRFQLCDGCDVSPASILCFTDHSVLCQNCDFELHKTFPSHDRRPLEGFNGCPSVVEMASLVGFEGFDAKHKQQQSFENEASFGVDLMGGFDGNDYETNDKINDEFCDLFEWGDTDGFVSIDELIASTDKTHSFHAMVVPPLPKDRNLSCGQYKQEMLKQLRELAKSELNINYDSDPLVEKLTAVADEHEKDFRVPQMFEASQHVDELASLRGPEARLYACCNDADEAANDVFVSSALSGSHHFEEIALNTESHSGICSGTKSSTATEPLTLPPRIATHEFNIAERNSALSRYKEKKRTRRYEKHVRYESRKVQAEHRTRIKGRFAKLEHGVNHS